MIRAVRLADGHGQDPIRDHPDEHHVRAHGLVVILLLLRFRDGGHGHLETVAQVAERFVVAGVNVELFRGHLELDRLALARRRAEIRRHDVVALGSPGDVVGVAESVDLERADVTGEEGKVGCGTGEHVPRIEVEEGHEEVKT